MKRFATAAAPARRAHAPALSELLTQAVLRGDDAALCMAREAELNPEFASLGEQTRSLARYLPIISRRAGADPHPDVRRAARRDVVGTLRTISVLCRLAAMTLTTAAGRRTRELRLHADRLERLAEDVVEK